MDAKDTTIAQQIQSEIKGIRNLLGCLIADAERDERYGGDDGWRDLDDLFEADAHLENALFHLQAVAPPAKPKVKPSATTTL